MEKLQNIFKKISNKVDIDKLKDPGSSTIGNIFNIFTKKSKREVLDFCLYKSNIILALSDDSLIVYDMLRLSQTLEITEVSKVDLNLIQLLLLHQINNYFINEMLLILCERTLLVLDFDIYEIHTTFELKTPTAQRMYLDYSGESYKLLILNKNSISIYDLLPFTNTKSKIKFNHIFEIDKVEQITNKSLLFLNNLIIFETKSKINFYKVDYNLPKEHPNKIRAVFFYKKDISIYKTDIIFNQGDSSMKYNEFSKDITFNFSRMTNTFYFTILNKIFLVKNNFTEHFMEEFEVIDRITKQNLIYMTKVEDPYIFFCTEGKIYIYFILNLEKCIEIINLESPTVCYNFQQVIVKNLNFLHEINKIDFETGLIQYSDSFHLNRVKYLNQKDPEYALNSSQHLLIFYNIKNLKFEWISSSGFEEQYLYLKNLNFDFSIKFLAFFKNQNSKILRNFIKKKNISEGVRKLNEENSILYENKKYFEKKSVQFFYLTFSTDYSQAKLCLEQLDINLIFVVMLMKNFISGKFLNILIHYLFCVKIGKDDREITPITSITDLPNQLSFTKNSDLIKEVNYYFQNYISSNVVQNEKDLFSFLKLFFGKFVAQRNEMKSSLDKEKRKKMNFDKIGENFSHELSKVLAREEYNKLYEEDNDSTAMVRIVSENFISFRNIFSKICQNSENELRYLAIENLVFIMNFYSFKITKNTKYQDSLKLMIKVSHHILDMELIKILKELNLEEEILLFYYYKGNYSKCINNIITIYESLDKISLSAQTDEDDHVESVQTNFDMLIGADKVEDNISNANSNEDSHYNENKITLSQNNFSHTGKNPNSLDKIKNQWLSRYVNLISLIGDKLTNLEFYEYIKWALSKNPFVTVDILLENGKISNKKLDLDFINLLKINGIDPVIYYLKKFLVVSESETGDSLHHNEMINLYTIKLKLLLEAVEKELEAGSNSTFGISASTNNMPSNLNFYKWNKKILKTREEFCYFLIENNFYDLDIALNKIKSLKDLHIEFGIVLIRQNKYEEGIPKIFFSEFPSTLKIFRKLFTVLQVYEFVYLALKCIITNYYKNPNDLAKNNWNVTTSLDTNDHNESFSIEAIVLFLLEGIKENYSLLNDVLALDILNSLQADKFFNFSINILANLDWKSKNLKIESSLINAKVLSSHNSLFEHQKENIAIDNSSTCDKCMKGFFDSQIVFVYPKSLYHFECYDKLMFYQ